jgi:hypothetical protein
MADVFQEYFAKLALGGKQSYKNMAVYPLVSGYSAAVEYSTLDEAVQLDMIEVVEVSESGRVPELKVKNKSPVKVLIIDGEELVGAKQNRVVNTTILLQEESEAVIPVSCVEQGRWSYSSDRFASKKRFAHSHLRAMKAEQVNASLKRAHSFEADQGEIWNEIDAKARRRDAASPSMEMGRIYERDIPHLEEYGEHFGLLDHQVGAVFVINGRIVGMDSFGKAETFAEVHEKLVNSYSLDAVDWFNREKGGRTGEDEVAAFLDAGVDAEKEGRDSVQLGIDYRFESPRFTGLALAYEGQLLHLFMFARQQGRRERQPGMGRFSRRMRNRG